MPDDYTGATNQSTCFGARIPFIHDNISLIQFVIPGLTRPAPYLIRGNPGLFWIPAFAGMTRSALINVAMY